MAATLVSAKTAAAFHKKESVVPDLTLPNTDEYFSTMSLPISNDENRKLEEDLHEQRFKLNKCQREIASLDQSMQTMWQHLQNIKSDVDQNQKLLRAKEAALETENRMISLSKLDLSKLQSDLKAKENLFKDTYEKHGRCQKLLECKKKELEKIHLDAGQSREDFEAELAKVLKADDKNVNIQKDMIIEEHITTEMSAKLERFNEQIAKKRNELESLRIELKALQLSLDKANADLELEQAERQRLIQQCESTMGIWNKREGNYQTLQEQLQEFRSESETLQKSLKERMDEVRSQHMTNKELLRKITSCNDQLTKMKSELNKLDVARQKLQDEIVGQRATASNLKSKQKTLQVQIEQFRSDIAKKESTLQQLKQSKETKAKNVEEAKSQHESATDKAKRLNGELKIEQAKKQILDKQKISLSDSVTKKKDQIVNGKKEEKRLRKEIDANNALNRNLNSKIKQLEREVGKHQENIDSKESEIKRLERELELIAGSDVRTADIDFSTSTVALKKKLEKLKLNSMEKEAAAQTWESTVKKTETDLEKIRKDVSRVDQLKKSKENSLSVLQAETEKLEKANKKIIEEKQDILVQSNLLKVEVKRLEDNLDSKSVEVFTVGQEKENISFALRTHQQEIRVKKELLQVEYCQLEEERKKMSIQFKELLNKIEQLKNRYDIYVISLRPPDNEKHDAEKYYLTKFEKEKEELSVLSEELNTKIKASEKELMALENTLKLVAERNRSFRHGIVQADKHCPDYQEKSVLEQQYRTLGETYAEAVKELKAAQRRLEEMESDMTQINDQTSSLADQTKLERLEAERLRNEISEQELKLERWDKQTAKATEEFRKTKSAGKSRNVVHLIEADMDLQQSKALTNAACKILAVLSHRNPETADLIVEEFRQYDLPLDFSIDSSTTNTKRSDVDSAISSQRSFKSNSAALVMKKVSLDAESLPRIETKPTSGQKPWSKRNSQSLPRVSRK